MRGSPIARLIDGFHRYGVLTIYALVCIFPLAWMLLTSLRPDVGEFSYDMSSMSLTLDNYIKVLTRDAYGKFLGNSVIISLATVAVCLPIGATAGYAIARFNFRGKENFFFFGLSTRMGPPVAIAVPLFILMLRFDLLDRKAGMVLVYLFMNLGLAIWMCRGFFADLPRDVEESALLDGLNDFQVMLRIAVPMAIGGLVATGILIFLFTWNEYFFASVLTRTDARPFTVHLPSYFGNRRILWGPLSAASFLGAIVPITLALIARRYLVDGFTFGTVRSRK